MASYRTIFHQNLYDEYTAKVQKSNYCQFCELKQNDTQVINACTNFKVIRNIFPYDVWDAQSVIDHLMIVPNQHTETLADLSDSAAIEFVKLVASYESIGYNIYARSPHSTVKSVLHQHTHLLKTCPIQT